MKGTRPYVRSDVDWVDGVLEHWSEQVRRRPRADVMKTSGGRAVPIYVGGPLSGRETALGRPSRPTQRGREPQGHVVEGLRGAAATADRVILIMAGINPRSVYVIRAEYGLIPDLDRDAPIAKKAVHLGAYVDGRPWTQSAYADRLKRGLEMFATGYLALM